MDETEKIEGEWSVVTLTEKSGHLAWCALVALALARQDGSVQSPAQENLFLTRWLATALKQRRFARVVSPDIEWLLKQGRQLGVSWASAGRQCETGQQTELPVELLYRRTVQAE